MRVKKVLSAPDMAAADRIRIFHRVALVASMAAWLVACGGNDRGGRDVKPKTTTAPRWTELTLKCEDLDSQGHPIGPAILSGRNDAQDYDAQWHTRADVRAIAKRLHLRYGEDC
jgi:hypothetical protein